jgi:uncharacterized protein (DUF305 family)
VRECAVPDLTRYVSPSRGAIDVIRANDNLKRLAASCLVSALMPLSAAAQDEAPIIQPGAPGESSRAITAEEASDLAGILYTDADVEFMQGMIMHHAQALDMTALVEERSESADLHKMAERIELSQEDEIQMMQGWLEAHGQEVTSAHAHHAHGAELMPGMLTPEEMARLEAARGKEFDQLFLELMIKHHQGALIMVDELLDNPGAAQESVMFTFTADIQADQEAEIDRMGGLLATLSSDPRVGLEAGFLDAGQAVSGMELLAAVPKPAGFFNPEYPAGLPVPPEEEDEGGTGEVSRADDLSHKVPQSVEVPEADGEPAEADTGTEKSEEDMTEEEKEAKERQERREKNREEGKERAAMIAVMNFANSDLAFTGDVLVQGNYHGFNIYDISEPTAPVRIASVVCPGGQGDVSIVGDLLIMSVEQSRGRLDCGLQGVTEVVSEERFRGIRIFDISDLRTPRQVAAVQTCRGSHTHTVVTDPDDQGNFYVYVSGTAGVREGEELAGCTDAPQDEQTALFSIDVIQVPYERPEEARIVSRPRIFADPETGSIAGLWKGGDHGLGTQDTYVTNQCHDITVLPEAGLAAGACSGNGILMDISDPVNPVRLDAVVDEGFAYWHSATFNNDGTKVLFTDEWGGGGRPRCKASDPKTWGADAIYDIVDNKLVFRGYYKMPAPQTEEENCVAHNGSLVPIPGRDVMVQAWYQGGLSVFDFTDSANPVEIAFFDRGPVNPEEMVMAGHWSTYWHKGRIYGAEIARGLDVLKLVPSEYLTQNEIDAAATIDSGIVNAQYQKRFVFPAEPVVGRAYVDQLERDGALDAGELQALREALDDADAARSTGETDAPTAARLGELAASLDASTDGASGKTRDRMVSLAEVLRGLAGELG